MAHPRSAVKPAIVLGTLISVTGWAAFWFVPDSTWLVVVASLALLLVPVGLQIWAGIGTLRAGTPAAPAVMRVTVRFWAAATAVFVAMALVALVVDGEIAPRDAGVIPRFGVLMLGSFWAAAAVCGGVVVAVVELVRWASGRSTLAAGQHRGSH